MNILITGGLGKVGTAVTALALERGHKVSVFSQPDSQSARAAKAFEGRASIIYGTVEDPASVYSAVVGADCVLHLAAIVPPKSEVDAGLTYAVNVLGTKNVAGAIIAAGRRAKLIFASSTSVMGPTQHKDPPVHPKDIANPTNFYTCSKIDAEKMLHGSEVDFTVLRLASVMSDGGGYDNESLRLLFDFPLEGRNEVVMAEDVATAMLNCADMFEDNPGAVSHKTFFIGGGRKRGCQIKNRDLVSGMFRAMGISMLPADCFVPDMDKYYMDWYDTTISQVLLKYQNHTFEEYLAALRERAKKSRRAMKFVSPVLTASFEKMSPYCKRK